MGKEETYILKGNKGETIVIPMNESESVKTLIIRAAGKLNVKPETILLQHAFGFVKIGEDDEASLG